MSNLEKKVDSILRLNGVYYIREKQFKDLRNGLYRFDFYIPSEKIAIEVQGAQHYQFTSYFYKNRSDFLKAKERDRLKISYCLAHQIRLYCIPYWDIDTVSSFFDLTRTQYLATSKFHNDEVWRQQKLRDE